MKINFITSNFGKIASLNRHFAGFNCNDIEIVSNNLDLIEPQADTVAEVSLFKARQAFKLLKECVLVEDGGFAIDALNGFPGVYTKFINETLGVEGYMKLMHGVENRNAKWLSVATFIDSDGSEYQFHRKGGETNISHKISNKDNPKAWSALWKIVWIDRFQKNMADMTEEEFIELHSGKENEHSLGIFAEWFVKNKLGL